MKLFQNVIPTSWDSFSYAIQMGHNVWSHINAVQEANRQYDNGVVPAMLVEEQFHRVYFRDVVEAIFATLQTEMRQKQCPRKKKIGCPLIALEEQQVKKL